MPSDLDYNLNECGTGVLIMRSEPERLEINASLRELCSTCWGLSRGGQVFRIGVFRAEEP